MEEPKNARKRAENCQVRVTTMMAPIRTIWRKMTRSLMPRNKSVIWDGRGGEKRGGKIGHGQDKGERRDMGQGWGVRTYCYGGKMM